MESANINLSCRMTSLHLLLVGIVVISLTFSEPKSQLFLNRIKPDKKNLQIKAGVEEGEGIWGWGREGRGNICYHNGNSQK